jgi:hypothetical protein
MGGRPELSLHSRKNVTMELSLVKIWESMGLLAPSVAIALVGMGLASVFVAIERLMVLSRAVQFSAAFATKACPLMESRALEALHDLTKGKEFAAARLPRLFRFGLETTTVRLLDNIAGRSIVEVGGAGLPDIYAEPRHDLRLAFDQRIVGGLACVRKGREHPERTRVPDPGGADHPSLLSRRLRRSRPVVRVRTSPSDVDRDALERGPMSRDTRVREV